MPLRQEKFAFQGRIILHGKAARGRKEDDNLPQLEINFDDQYILVRKPTVLTPLSSGFFIILKYHNKT